MANKKLAEVTYETPEIYIEPPPPKPESKEELRLLPVLLRGKDENGKSIHRGTIKKWLTKKQALEEGCYWKEKKDHSHS